MTCTPTRWLTMTFSTFAPAVAAQRDQRLNAARTDKERAAIRAACEAKIPLVPDRPGITDAFREWSRKQGFAFCNEDVE